MYVPNSLVACAGFPLLPLLTLSPASDESKIFSITKERQQGAEPARPSFIRDHQLAFQDPVLYQQVVLPSVSELTFEISSLPDVQHFRAMLAAESQMPQFWRAVTKVAFPGFYWFSGIAHNRTCNPYLEVVGNLPFLSELSLTFHTAGLTHSRYGERDRLKIEETDIEKSKELKVTRVADVVRKYDLSSVFKCTSLRILRLECFDSQIVDHFTGTVDQFSSFRELQYFFIDGFRQYCGREIQVCSKVIPIEWKDEDAM